MPRTEMITVNDAHGFHYEVLLEHHHNEGFSNALHEGKLIAQCGFGKCLEPSGDSDLEWENFEQAFGDWAFEAKQSLYLDCVEYFNRQ